MPGTVSEVSAMLVANTIRRPVCAVKMRCCSDAGSRACNATSSTCGQSSAASAVRPSRISRSPNRRPGCHRDLTAQLGAGRDDTVGLIDFVAGRIIGT
jgi:hypothetical protein